MTREPGRTRRRPKSALFYSTIRAEVPWGAPDYVWPIAAQKLLERGIPVTAVIPRAAFDRSEITTLVRLGVTLVEQPPMYYSGGRISKVRQWLARLSGNHLRLNRVIEQMDDPHWFINQGGSLDICYENTIIQWLRRESFSYDVFCRSNRYCSPLSMQERERCLRILSGADRCLFNSQWTQQLTELQLLARLPNVVIFPHLVRFDYTQALPWPSFPDRRLRLASVSRLDTEHKGLDVLLLGLAQLAMRNNDWVMDFYGGGAELGYLQALRDFLGLQSQVNFHGAITSVKQIWETHHLLVLTSRYEGLSVAMLEAMACARPVLRTPYGGCREWVRDGETGLVCAAPEPELIAQSIERAIHCRDELRTVAMAGFKLVSKELTRRPWEIYLTPFLDARTIAAIND